MPRRTEQNGPNEDSVNSTGSTALALPDDIRQDLLRAQQESIQTPQQLPQVRAMPAGVGLFEFKDTNTMVPTFQGVILANHPRNVLWDRKFGDSVPTNDDQATLPACSSVDGRYGTPRQGFKHIMINDGQTPADGSELIACATCKYNKWGSGNLLIASNNARGKAVTNQRSVYILVPDGRQAPVELVLSPTSISAFDEYLMTLLNRQIPVQAVLTEFSQEVKQKTGSQVKWGIVTFKMLRELSNEEFQQVLAKRSQYQGSMSPSSVPVAEVTPLPDTPDEEVLAESDEIPF